MFNSEVFISEVVHAPIDEVERMFRQSKNFKYQTERLDYEMDHNIRKRRQRDIASVYDGDEVFTGHSRLFRNFGILEPELYRSLIENHGLSPDHFSWNPKESITDGFNIYGQAVHENTIQPGLVYLFDYTFAKPSGAWVGLRLGTRRMNRLYEQLLAEPIPGARDQELKIPFTLRSSDSGQFTLLPSLSG